MNFSLAFYQWFLAELLEALRALEASDVERVEESTTVAITPAWHVSRNDRSIITRRQSLLVPRPRQPLLTVTVDGIDFALGDNTRATRPRPLGRRRNMVPQPPPPPPPIVWSMDYYAEPYKYLLFNEVGESVAVVPFDGDSPSLYDAPVQRDWFIRADGSALTPFWVGTDPTPLRLASIDRDGATEVHDLVKGGSAIDDRRAYALVGGYERDGVLRFVLRSRAGDFSDHRVEVSTLQPTEDGAFEVTALDHVSGSDGGDVLAVGGEGWAYLLHDTRHTVTAFDEGAGAFGASVDVNAYVVALGGYTQARVTNIVHHDGFVYGDALLHVSGLAPFARGLVKIDVSTMTIVAFSEYWRHPGGTASTYFTGHAAIGVHDGVLHALREDVDEREWEYRRFSLDLVQTSLESFSVPASASVLEPSGVIRFVGDRLLVGLFAEATEVLSPVAVVTPGVGVSWASFGSVAEMRSWGEWWVDSSVGYSP